MVERKILKCNFCGWQWIARKENVRVCPKCHNPIGEKPKYKKHKRGKYR